MLFFRRHRAAFNRSGSAVNRQSNFLCFHVWIVIRPCFRRRSIKKHESKEAIGQASSSKSHQRKCNAVAHGMSKGFDPMHKERRLGQPSNTSDGWEADSLVRDFGAIKF